MARVLIAEPSPDVRALLAHAIRRLGHEPVIVAPWAALEGDVLLIEPALPGSVALARRLRERDPELPILICSIHSPSDELRALGPVAHLVKPFDRGALERALTAATDAAQAA